ncbi:flagellar basal body-associated protein FliL [Oxobacter pfennigii]|uniref:Flagellar protein FliL n=1 Tax=Oxobacter pfennigii TaxID=36849 RepID=A0A0P8WAG2_9CLOT|nr:flagellar basal body-associated FliL family protein [Oxobacter pfennigii]KPU44699.1 flagellar basal body-associated protein FliL [Oxobacter pfennigii]
MNKKMLPVIILVVLFIVAAVLAIILFRLGIISPTSNSGAPPKEITFDVGEYSVNLDEPGYRRYMKTNIFVGYTVKKLEKELAEKTPQMRSIITDILRSKKVEDVSSTDAMEVIKGEIKNSINEILTTGKIDNIYITDIIIQ